MARSAEDNPLIQLPDDAPPEVREFLDQRHRRASIADDGRIMLNASQVLTNIEDTMGRVHADINIEVSIAEDIATDSELMALMGTLRMDSFLITFLVNTGMRFMTSGGYPAEFVTRPLPDDYDISVMVPALQVNQRQHQVAKAIFDERSVSPEDLTEDDITVHLQPLNLAEKLEVFLILVYCARPDSDRIEWFSRAA